MKRRLLFIVTSDPRIDSGPAEAVRIAAGVGVWKRVEIALYLRDEAVRALGEAADGLLHEEDWARYWEIFTEASQPVYAQKNAAALQNLGAPAVAFTEISDAELAKLAAEQTCVLRF